MGKAPDALSPGAGTVLGPPDLDSLRHAIHSLRPIPPGRKHEFTSQHESIAEEVPKLIAELEEVKRDLQESLWALRDALGYLGDQLPCKRTFDLLNSKLDARCRAKQKMEADQARRESEASRFVQKMDATKGWR